MAEPTQEERKWASMILLTNHSIVKHHMNGKSTLLKGTEHVVLISRETKPFEDFELPRMVPIFYKLY